MNAVWPVIVRAFFALCFRFLDLILFAKHHWYGDLPFLDGPVLLIANHTSWWDGIWIWQRNRARWQLHFCVPMLQQSLKRWPFLRQLGGLPLSRSKALALQAKNVMRSCAERGQLLLFFPEGQIRRSLPKQHQFKAALLQRLLKQPRLQLAFVYQVVTTTNRPQAEVFHFIQATPLGTVEELQTQYAEFAAACEHQISKYLEQEMEQL